MDLFENAIEYLKNKQDEASKKFNAEKSTRRGTQTRKPLQPSGSQGSLNSGGA